MQITAINIRMLSMLYDFDFTDEKNSNLPIMPVTAGYTDCQDDIFRPKGFFANHILWVLHGEGTLEFKGTKQKLKEGQGFFSCIRTPHAYYSDGNDFQTMWFTYKGGDFLNSYYQIEDGFIFDVPANLTNATHKLIEDINGTTSSAQKSALTYAYIISLFDRVFEKPASFSRKVIEYLEANHQRALSLDDIAHEFLVDKYKLCHVFSQETGSTVMNTLRTIRIRKAKNLLIYSSSSIERIASLCGFDSTSYFIKTFRECVKMTPLQYRNSENGT